MANDNLNTQKLESPSADLARGAVDQMIKQVHNLRYQCPNGGNLVEKPSDCGDPTARPLHQMSQILPPLKIG